MRSVVKLELTFQNSWQSFLNHESYLHFQNGRNQRAAVTAKKKQDNLSGIILGRKMEENSAVREMGKGLCVGIGELLNSIRKEGREIGLALRENHLLAGEVMV